MTREDVPPVSPALDFVAGTIAGSASLLCGHPFDTIKVKLQCLSTPGKPLTAMKAFTSIWKEEKLKGLYKGVLSPMLGIAAINASCFGCYGVTMRLQLKNPGDSPSLAQITAAGSASGIFTSIITTPIERLKILQQSSSPANTAAQPSLRHLLSTLPIRSLYRGLTATIVRDTGYGPYFLTYELISRGFPDSDGERKYKADLADEIETESRDVPWSRLILAGGAAGVVGWGCTFPLDVIKTRMQSVPHPPPRGSDRTTWQTTKSAYQTSGKKIFIAGLGPTLLRAIPVNIVCFLVFEVVVSALR